MRFESEETTLPGLRWTIEDGDRAQFEAQFDAYSKALTRARDLTRELTAEFRADATQVSSP